MPTVGHSRRSRPRAAVSRCWRTCSTRSFIFLIRVADDPAVGLELALAGSAGADAAAGARQVGPQPGQARQLVLELGELDLEAALVGLRVLREDVEDQPAAVDDLDLEQLLEGALLGRRQLVVGDEQRRSRSRAWRAASSSALPLPTYQFGSTWRRFCHSAPTTSAPAVVGEARRARRASPRRSSRRRRRCRRRRGRPSRRAAARSMSVRSCGHRGAG